MKTTIDNFARALTMLRGLYFIKTSELATLCKVTRTTILNLENNVSGPSRKTLEGISKIFEISFDNLVQIIETPYTLSNAQILIYLKPSRYSEIIDATLSYARVAKIIRLLKNLPYMTAALPNKDTKHKLSNDTVYRIEKLKCIPSIKTIKHLCSIYDISLEKYFYYVKATSSMTMIEAAIFIAMDFES